MIWKNWKKTPHFFTLTHDATTHHSLLLLSLLSYHRHCSAAITTQSKTLSPRFVANVATHPQWCLRDIIFECVPTILSFLGKQERERERWWRMSRRETFLRRKQTIRLKETSKRRWRQCTTRMWCCLRRGSSQRRRRTKMTTRNFWCWTLVQSGRGEIRWKLQSEDEGLASPKRNRPERKGELHKNYQPTEQRWLESLHEYRQERWSLRESQKRRQNFSVAGTELESCF